MPKKINYVNLAGIDYQSLVNGVGIRMVIFFQGCKHHCLGCFNPET
jgi:anaerobic ribonucleoside-triphosphate reductase activating protein